jgi:hypothetical protein
LDLRRRQRQAGSDPAECAAVPGLVLLRSSCGEPAGSGFPEEAVLLAANDLADLDRFDQVVVLDGGGQIS